MKHLYLADLTDHNRESIKQHISREYSSDCDEPTRLELMDILDGYDVLVAYEHVGSWGCDSASWFLLQHKESKEYFEFSGSHCSCYGFEGQFDLEETSLEYLKSDKFSFGGGGYDDDYLEHKGMVKDFLQNL